MSLSESMLVRDGVYRCCDESLSALICMSLLRYLCKCVCVCVCVCVTMKKSARRMASTTSDTGDTFK